MRKKPWLVAGAFFLCCIIASLAVYARSSIKDVKTAQGTASAFLLLLQNHNFTAAYDLLAPQVQRQITANDVQRIQDNSERRMGLVIGKPKCVKWEAHAQNGVKTVRLLFLIPFQRGVKPALMTLGNFHGFWRVEAFQYEMGSRLVPAPGSPS